MFIWLLHSESFIKIIYLLRYFADTTHKVTWLELPDAGKEAYLSELIEKAGF